MSSPINLLDVVTDGRELPEGCDTWGIRTVRPDGASSHKFVWPLTPGWVEAPGPIVVDNYSACPSEPGDGLCVAHTWTGMASGGIPARVLLLCAVNSADVLGKAHDQLRARRVYVVEVLDGERLIRERAHCADLCRADLSHVDLTLADLRRANLSYANLSYANLSFANLSFANLSSADLRHANLSTANLRSASLYYAHLSRADLRYANLSTADLSGAILYYADLSRADLRDADLRRANLSYANLRHAHLSRADLRYADLSRADLRDADLGGADLEGTYLGSWERDPDTGLARRRQETN